MDFALTPGQRELRARAAAFLDEVLIPLELTAELAGGRLPEADRRHVRDQARERGLDEAAGTVLELSDRKRGLLGEGELHVTDGAGQAPNLTGDGLVPLPAEAGWPLYRGGEANARLPLIAHLGEIVGEDEGGAGAI